jgi:sugar/nucleoside kinase (ribokinase family)
MFDLVTVGHFSIDLIISPKIASPKPTLGGSPTYTSLSAKRLGAKVSVVSKVGEDFRDEYITWLSTNGVDLSGLKRVNGVSTTSFILKYMKGNRRLQLRSRAPPIDLEDIPNSMRAKAVHVAPIAGEVSPEVIDKLRSLADILSLDPQGFVRRFDESGNVSLKRWKDSRVLGQIDVYKSSMDEIRMVTELTDLRSAMKKIYDYGAKAVMVTKGLRGSSLFFEGSFYDVPACKPRVVQDATGAGDAFIGAFLAEYVQGKDAFWCACVGSAVASYVTEGIGPAVFGHREEIYERANKIYKRGKP